MKGVDTNVLLRFIVRDDARQFDAAAAFLTARTPEDPVFISLIVVAELVWALDRRYRYGREQIHGVVVALLETAEVVFEDEPYLSSLLAARPKGDIADHLIAHCAMRAGCSSIATFDVGAAKVVPPMELLA